MNNSEPIDIITEESPATQFGREIARLSERREPERPAPLGIEETD